MADTVDLTKGIQGILDAAGAATLRIGPGHAGRQNWHVTALLLKSSRPGVAPIPRAEVWLDSQDVNSQKGLTYDGSFASGQCDIAMSRGQELIVTWTGGQVGDTVYVTVNGEQW